MIFPHSNTLDNKFFFLLAPFAIMEIFPFSFVKILHMRLVSLKGIVFKTTALESINN